MMRNIKFRVWDRNKKMMEKVVCIKMLSPYVYTNVIVEFKERGRVINDNHLIGGTDGCDTAILMQYVGLKDRNGKEIYEGDILKGINTNQSSCDYKPFKVVVTHEGSNFLMRFVVPGAPNSLGMRNHMDSWSDHVVFEVIGNRYENPDLLKENEGDK